jgi:hypothetical protein
VEARTGIVPAAETLYVTTALRPLQWFAAQGAARIAATFVGDTIFGAVSAPSGKRQMILASRPDLVTSQAMLDATMPLLAFLPEWSDSVGVLAVDMAGASVIPSELTVIGEEDLMLDSLTARPAWVVALRAETQSALFWIDKENGEPLRMQQRLPSHVGTLLEYRLRVAPAPPG